jgi:hypothetical protein
VLKEGDLGYGAGDFSYYGEAAQGDKNGETEQRPSALFGRGGNMQKTDRRWVLHPALHGSGAKRSGGENAPEQQANRE